MLDLLSNLNVVLAHHWIASYRGGERVLEQMAALLPHSHILTLFRNQTVDIPGLRGRDVRTSSLQRIPSINALYRHLLPLHPSAIRRLTVDPNVDLLLSSDASLIKGLPHAKETTHVCYCHSPPRYLWEMAEEYKSSSLAARFAFDRFVPQLRRFDYEAAQRVTHFIANSHFVADRIARYYDRSAEVIYPPVDVHQFEAKPDRQPFSLVISELVPYKRIDIAVEAFNRLGRRLVIIGDGPERRRLESMAQSNVEFLGRQPFEVLKLHYEAAAHFIFPGIEDFGITAVEAQAAGCPVIAFRAGGALETVIDQQTGAFFDEQNAESLAEAIIDCDQISFDTKACATRAASFAAGHFRSRLQHYLTDVMMPQKPSLMSA